MKAAFPPISTASGTATNDSAGGSAQHEYDRRSAKERARADKRIAEDAAWRTELREKKPFVGRFVTALTPKPQVGPESQSTMAWKVGAEGERRVAEVLTGLPGIEVLHDRLIPRSKANIDHIVVGSTGVFVIDAKNYTGAVETRDVGGWFRTDVRLYVNGRDRTTLVEGLERQIETVRLVLGTDCLDVPVRGVLCFVGAEWGWMMRPQQIRGVTVLWPLKLAEHVIGSGPYADRVPAIADGLRKSLRPATKASCAGEPSRADR
ncbi:MAG: nuclease-related domain-containing protein [Ilumatobacteraceae bacterium]